MIIIVLITIFSTTTNNHGVSGGGVIITGSGGPAGRGDEGAHHPGGEKEQDEGHSEDHGALPPRARGGLPRQEGRRHLRNGPRLQGTALPPPHAH